MNPIAVTTNNVFCLIALEVDKNKANYFHFCSQINQPSRGRELPSGRPTVSYYAKRSIGMTHGWPDLAGYERD